MPDTPDNQGGTEGQAGGAQDGAEGQVQGQQNDDSSGQSDAGDGGGKPKEEPTITETALKARMARAKKKWEEEKAEEQRIAQLSAEQRAQAEKEAAETRANQRIQQANERLINAEARGIAAELGIRADRVAAALKFADLSEIDVSDDGDPDASAIRSALSPVLDQFPEWGKPDVGKAPGNTKTGDKAPSGIDAQIQDARDKGDLVLADKLHSRKLVDQGLFKYGA